MLLRQAVMFGVSIVRTISITAMGPMVAGVMLGVNSSR